MKPKKIINLTILVILICLITGISIFIYNAMSKYRISNDFISIPLQFNPDNSSSTYQIKSEQVIVYNGFVKGVQKSKDGESIVIRALSPLPSITVKSSSTSVISFLIENINPDFYAKSILKYNLHMTKVKINTLHLKVNTIAGKTIRIEPIQPSNINNQKYIILGDNRDGYDTFEKIIQQVNGQNPVFVIDNGDLVFSGKPNQYRLFDQMASTISSTLCTTLGNHDIRGNGRYTYSMLYGPAYYSFDYGNSHFIFLDSSPGWAEKTAISDEQYKWLEKDLLKAQEMHIFIITHIPPHDPRSGVTKNEIPNYASKVENGENWFEQILNNYNENKSMDHGFQDPKEAKKFESLMSKYHVDSVYLSHIHSYLEYTKDNVRYLITGGAGAELLTKDSYYHYMIAKFNDINKITTVELPSPANTYLARYAATVQLFTNALYDENPTAVILIITGIGLIVLLLIVKLYLRKKQPLDTFLRWLFDIGNYAVKRYKELFNKR